MRVLSVLFRHGGGLGFRVEGHTVDNAAFSLL